MMVVGMFAMLVMVVLSGCVTHSILTTYDKDGKIATVTNASSDIVDKITQSTKDKTVIAWSSGWAGYLSVSMSTEEDPTPTGKIFAGKVDRGYMSIHKDQKDLNWDGIAKAISATSKSLGVSSPGIGGIVETPTPLENVTLPTVSGVVGGETGTPYVVTPGKTTGDK